MPPSVTPQNSGGAASERATGIGRQTARKPASSSHSRTAASSANAPDTIPSIPPNEGVGHKPEQLAAPRSASGTSSRSRVQSADESHGQPQASHPAPSFTPQGSRTNADRHQQSVSGTAQRAVDNSTTGKAVATSARRKRWRMVLIVLVVLLAALLTALIGAWRWVDSNLNKTQWLPGSPDSEGTSWLILGSDERDENGGVGGSTQDVPGARYDTILVLTRATNGTGSLISIPRDSLVNVNDQYMKINGVAELVSKQAFVGEVEDITGEHIDHVAQIRFDGLQQVVDSIGGVELCYEADVNDPNSGMVWTSGCHQADGATALAFSRMRYSDPKGDFGRSERQRQVIGAIIHKTLTREVLLSPSSLRGVAQTSLDSVIVDEDTNPLTLLMMALTMRAATGDDGVTGSVYWTDPDYRGAGVGSTVLLDEERNHALFRELIDGTHTAGTVGTLAESS